jgi:hypothetical protein
MHLARRGTSRDAAQLARAIIAHDDRPATAHQVAAYTPTDQLPGLVARLADRCTEAISRRRTAHQARQSAGARFASAMSQGRNRSADQRRTIDHGLEL